MKPRNYISAILVILAITFALPSSTYAHPHHRPHWVDVRCCDPGTRYIFFPEDNFYYDLEREVYIYPYDGMWLVSEVLPSMYINIDFAYVPIIELDLHINRPYLHNHDHIVWYRSHRHDHYVRYYDGHRYYREHPDYYREYHHDNGNHYGHYKKGHDNGNHYGHNKNGNDNHYGHRNGNGNHRGDGNGKGNHGNGNHGNGNYKKSDNKGNSEYVKRTNEPRGNASGNGRTGNGRQSNGRGR